MAIFQYIEWGAFGILLLGALLAIPAILRFIKGVGRSTKFPQTNERAKFAILIPARDESKVVEANIKSVLQSDYPKDKLELYLIVESEEDETVKIAAKYERTHVFVRQHLDRVGKGYALEECLTDIQARGEKYDAFLILDADNVVTRDFLLRMNEAYQAGYDLACGKRDNKDWNASVVSAASGLSFTAVNLLVNKPKTYLGKTVIVSGTGFFIRASRLEELGGWPFHSLTEDYEITRYSSCYGWKTGYVEDAVYYDEQPLKIGPSIVQRSRWVKGFFTVRGRYNKIRRKLKKEQRKNMNLKERAKQEFLSGIIPFLMVCVDLILYMVCVVTFFILSLVFQNGEAYLFGIRLLLVFPAVYILLTLLTVYLLFSERKTMKISNAMKVKVTFFHTFFLLTYAACAVRAIFMPNTWERIDHTIYKEIDD